jgi:hypothetical protein
MGPFSLDDSAGMGLAICILLRLLDPGKTEDTIQFSTARYLRSVFSNIYHASAEHQTGMAVMARGTTKIYVTDCPSYSYWFERFMQGVHKRMGEEVRSDYALSVQVLHQILANLERRWLDATAPARRKEVVKIAFFLVVQFCLGLRGEEVVKLDVAGFLTYFESGRDHAQDPHVMIPLMGRFKGETGERWHLLPLVWKTRSGIEAGVWAGRMRELLQERQRLHGFVFANARGKQAKAAVYEPRFFEQLNYVRTRHPALFPPGMDIEDDFGLSR